jgi:bisphosphoglycerate-independent phosphoglycerate mutase (AlkP superfamily)
VPVILVTPDDHPQRNARLRDGAVLSSVAPTMLELLGIAPPADMTSPSLIER